MRVLAFDPGKQNFAYAFGEAGVVERFGFVDDLVTDLTVDLSNQVAALAEQLRALIDVARPDHIVAERFMSRGLPGQGAVGEFVNLSLGVLVTAALPVPVQAIPSATWKNFWSRQTGWEKSRGRFEMLDVLDPDHQLRPGGRRRRLTTHESDAIGILLWRFDDLDRANLLASARAALHTNAG